MEKVFVDLVKLFTASFAKINWTEDREKDVILAFEMADKHLGIKMKDKVEKKEGEEGRRREKEEKERKK